MADMNAFDNLLNVVKKQVGPLVFEKVQEELEVLEGISFRIPLEKIINNPRYLEIAKEFELDNPEKMIKFMVESFYGAIEATHDEVISLKEMEINESIGIIQSAKRMFDYGMDNPESKISKLDDAQNDLFRAIEILERQVSTFVNSTREIDNKPKWQFFVRAKDLMKTIDSNIMLIRLSLDALENAVAMQMLIAKELGGKNIEKSVMKPYDNFYDQVLLCGDTCRLLDAYEFEDKKGEGYFLNLDEKKQKIREVNAAYEEYVDELEGYDDINFE